MLRLFSFESPYGGDGGVEIDARLIVEKVYFAVAGLLKFFLPAFKFFLGFGVGLQKGLTTAL